MKVPTPSRFRALSALFERQGNETIILIGRIPGFLSRDECMALVQLAQNTPAQSGPIGVASVIGEPVRRSEVRFFYPEESNAWLFDKLERAVFKLNESYRFELQGFYEGVQIASYGSGGHYAWHKDLGTGPYSCRKLSLSVQLSDERDYDGGELEFHANDDPVPRTQGTLIAFPSYLVHRVVPVTRGVRWSLVSWISGPAFR